MTLRRGGLLPAGTALPVVVLAAAPPARDEPTRVVPAADSAAELAAFTPTFVGARSATPASLDDESLRLHAPRGVRLQYANCPEPVAQITLAVRRFHGRDL